jgi:predicted nucleic acid-binding protein
MSVFFDTNVLVYLFDADAREKQVLAREIFDRHVREGSLRLSTQVLQELYVTLTRKLAVPMKASEAGDVIAALGEMAVTHADTPMVLAAIQLSQRQQLSFWDAMILESAKKSGAAVLLTEDLQHGQVIDDIRVENPFVVVSSTTLRR